MYDILLRGIFIYISAFCYHMGFQSLVSAESPTVALLEGGALCSEISIDHQYYYTLFPLSNELSNVVTGVIFVVLGALVVSLKYRFFGNGSVLCP